MRHNTKCGYGRRLLSITASVLVFLFAYHAKTSVYANGLGTKPHTATSSKLCISSQKMLKPQPPSSSVSHFQSFDFSNPLAGRVLRQVELAPGFAPVMCFSGLSPPLKLLENS